MRRYPSQNDAVQLTAFGDIAGTITGSTGVTVTAGAENVDPDGGAVSGQITSGNLISEDGDIEITGDQVSATVNAIGATSIGIVASGNFSGTANGADGLVNVNVKDDVTGAVNGNGNIEISAGRDISGAVHSSSGDIVQLLAGGDISGNADADAGRINQVTAGGTISGNMTAQEDIGGSGTSGLFGITAGVDITGTITSNAGDIYLVQALRDMNGEVTADSGELHLAKGGRDVDGDGISADTIDSVIAGRDMDTDVESTEALGTVSAGRTIDGDITSDNSSIGGVAAGSGWSDAFTTSGKINGSTIEAGTGIGNVTVNAALNYDGAIKNATITANDGFIGNITAVSGIDVTATASESIGNITTPRGDISGSVTAMLGDIGDVSANAGSISAALTAGEDIGNILAEQNISGNIEAQRNIATGTGQSITAVKGSISGNVHSSQGNIGNISGKQGVSGDIKADVGDIGSVTSWGDISGAVDAAGSVGAIWAFGDISGDIASGAGDVVVTAWGDVSGSIDAQGDVDVAADGDVTGGATSSDGGIYVKAWGGIQGNLQALGDVVVWAKDSIQSQMTSTRGSINAASWNSIAGSLTAAWNVSAWAWNKITASFENTTPYGTKYALQWGGDLAKPDEAFELAESKSVVLASAGAGTPLYRPTWGPYSPPGTGSGTPFPDYDRGMRDETWNRYKQNEAEGNTAGAAYWKGESAKWDAQYRLNKATVNLGSFNLTKDAGVPGTALTGGFRNGYDLEYIPDARTVAEGGSIKLVQAIHPRGWPITIDPHFDNLTYPAKTPVTGLLPPGYVEGGGLAWAGHSNGAYKDAPNGNPARNLWDVEVCAIHIDVAGNAMIIAAYHFTFDESTGALSNQVATPLPDWGTWNDAETQWKGRGGIVYPRY